MFELLTDIGFKEMEVGFPVASQDDYDFVRLLIEQDRIPDDVWITVGAPVRADLIRRTVRSLIGAERAVIGLYNATAPLHRRVVFGMDRAACKDLAVRGTTLLLKFAEDSLRNCDLGFEYTLECFNETELEFSLEVCDAIMKVWQPGPGRQIILNFPTTVERTLPNVFADQIEWMHRNLPQRENVCLSIHPHNDRGTAVSTAELAMLAGAERVEGCLFGNGERAGNVCLVTLGLNLFAHGIDPGIDFSDLTRIREVVEYCTHLPVHPRHPYGGDLVHTAFSGAHQDAIKKGFDALDRAITQAGTDSPGCWEMPYLPIDPRDVGRTYEAVIRVNSQSGKGGVAYIMRTWHGLDLPRGLQIEFARLVQARTEATGQEVSPAQMWRIFADEYLTPAEAPAEPAAAELAPAADVPTVVLYVDDQAEMLPPSAVPGRLSAIEAALRPAGIDAHAIAHSGSRLGHFRREGSDSGCAVYARYDAGEHQVWGVGIDPNVVEASFAAVRSALHRAC